MNNPTTELSKAVHELTRDHAKLIKRDNGKLEKAEELSLLKQLEEAKTMRLHSAGGSANSGSKIPFGVTPHDIEAEIIKTIHYTASIHDRYRLSSMPLDKRIQEWSEIVDSGLALGYVESWSESIRDLFRTKFAVAGRCTECCSDEVVTDLDGEVKKKPALIVTVELERITCGACGAYWDGEDNLRALVKHIE